jgi:hypothetical protein
MTDATRRVTQWIIGVRGEVPLVEELATAEDVQSFVCGGYPLKAGHRYTTMVSGL